MKKFFKNLLTTKQIEIEVPEPSRFPNFDNVCEWMDQKVSYFAQKQPNDMHYLFNPSSGDYLPLNIAAGTSERIFKENLEHYRNIKKQYPEAVEQAKRNYVSYSRSTVGDPQDYPDRY